MQISDNKFIDFELANNNETYNFQEKLLETAINAKNN